MRLERRSGGEICGMGIWGRVVQSAVRSGGMERAAGLWRRGMSKMILPSGSIHPPILAAPPRLPLPMPDAEAATLQSALDYTFEDRTLLEDALTHTSYPNRGLSSLTIPPSRRSYKPLKAMGERLLFRKLRRYSLAILLHLNLSPHKFARTALSLQLYDFVRRQSPKLDRSVEEFIKLQKGDIPYQGIPLKVPTVLPDVVHSLTGAIMADREYEDDDLAWKVIMHHLKPIILPYHLYDSVEALRRVCEDHQMSFKFRKMRNGFMNTTHVLINKYLHGSATSEDEDQCVQLAALDALDKLPSYMLTCTRLDPMDSERQLVALFRNSMSSEITNH